MSYSQQQHAENLNTHTQKQNTLFYQSYITCGGSYPGDRDSCKRAGFLVRRQKQDTRLDFGEITAG